MAAEQTTKDSQDQAFGAAAAEDQAVVDELEAMGAGEEDLPAGRQNPPRAAGKAEPDEQAMTVPPYEPDDPHEPDAPDGPPVPVDRRTGDDQAARNRDEDPPA